MRNFLKANNRGQSVIEVLVGMGLLTIIGSAFISGMVSMRKLSKGTVVISATDKQVNDIAENIKAGVENYQINFKYQDGTSEVLKLSNLPMAWDIGKVAPKSKDTETWGGTYGYTIQPYEAYRGLYKVTLRMTYKAWADNGEKYRDYTFVVSAK